METKMITPADRLHIPLAGAMLEFSARGPSSPHGGPNKNEHFPLSRPDLTAHRAIIVDDQSTGRMVLERILRKIDARLEIDAFGDPQQALEHITERTPDLVVTDYKMPGMDGLELVRRIRAIPECVEVPVVVVTIVDDKTVRYKALDAGVSDFINRPIDQYECYARCRNLLKAREHQKIIRNRAAWLEMQVALATRQIKEREKDTLLCLSRAGEYRDEGTGNHVLRMARYSRIIAEGLGLPAADCDSIERAAPLHDIGKIGIPDHILLKPERLDPEEMEIMKTHARIGYQILASSHSPYIQLGAQIALAHHERYNGSGYPEGAEGDAIPVAARIVAIADVYDALTTSRPYKSAWPHEEAVAYIRDLAGTHFDPQCVRVFLDSVDRIDQIRVMLED